jgi:transmembrane sensor
MHRYSRRVAVITVALALLAAASDVDHHPTAEYSTQRGDRYQGALPDNSGLVLNTDSAILLDFTDDTRAVYLNYGEVVFRINPRDPRPFLLHRGDITLTTPDAVFSVRTLTENAILLNVLSGSMFLRETLFDLFHPFELEATLIPKRSYNINEGHLDIVPFSQASADCLWAWERGELCLVNQPLQAAVEEVNRYTRRRLIIGDPSLNTLRVGGRFDIAALLPDFPDALKRSFGIRPVMEDNTVVLLPPCDPVKPTPSCRDKPGRNMRFPARESGRALSISGTAD